MQVPFSIKNVKDSFGVLKIMGVKKEKLGV